MIELNPDTGQLIPGFGREGIVDLNDQLRGPARTNRIGDGEPRRPLQAVTLSSITHGGVLGNRYAICARRSPRLGRSQRKVALDVPHDSISRRRRL